MKMIRYYFIKVIGKFLHRGRASQKEHINKWFRKQGIEIGENCSIFSNIISSEPYLISIGDNVTISNSVQLITHDNSIIKASNAKYTDIFGKINVGNNSFIGAHAIILPGVSLCDGTIVAAGSVVTKSIYSEYSIIGGNPAKIIGTWSDFLQINDKYGIDVSSMSNDKKREYILGNPEYLKSR
ncbi:MAG: acyltransferase [Candidatus Metalachnospira sp.]|nr:acyltransferase [Candidatus Metalachnospira sp.]